MSLPDNSLGEHELKITTHGKIWEMELDGEKIFHDHANPISLVETLAHHFDCDVEWEEKDPYPESPELQHKSGVEVEPDEEKGQPTPESDKDDEGSIIPLLFDTIGFEKDEDDYPDDDED